MDVDAPAAGIFLL